MLKWSVGQDIHSNVTSDLTESVSAFNTSFCGIPNSQSLLCWRLSDYTVEMEEEIITSAGQQK